VKLTYLLGRPELGGGTRVVLAHAELLAARGHRVAVAGEGPLPAAFGFRGRWIDLEREPAEGGQDLVIATFWSTLERARQLALGPVAHFCQGYEGEIPHFAAERRAIDAVYSQPVPTLAVTPRLVRLLADRFGREARLAPPPLALLRRPPWRWRPRRHPWIALFGAFEAEVKGIRAGLEAVATLRSSGRRARLLRVSVLPLTAAEQALAAPDRYLESVAPEAAQAALAQCDLLLFPVTEAEGFGLPLLEALGLGVPAVASDTEALRFLTGEGGARRVPVGDGRLFAREAAALLGSGRAWRAQRRRGRAAAVRFAGARVGAEVEDALSWAAARARGNARP
jgi:glycosyltransferase involved in cell wall biosynthesis